MPVITPAHAHRSVADIAKHGDNDILPFDIDNRFFGNQTEGLSKLVAELSEYLEQLKLPALKKFFKSTSLFSERLLAPSGYAGFRITTKIHPFWNAYLNTLAVAIAELHEPIRSSRAHSYRFAKTGDSLFDRAASWRSFREATLADREHTSSNHVVVETDISNFYEHVYHHRLQNIISDILPIGSNLDTQIDRVLNQFSSGRSFGLPVGGQAARVLSEVLMSSVDRTLTDTEICWRRYVDDFVIVSKNQHKAYQDLGALANALSDVGLSLNRSKTSFLSANHYVDYMSAQLYGVDEGSYRLKEIDLHFDPYSDNPSDSYEELKETIRQIDVAWLLDEERRKAQADPFTVSQISRSLRLMDHEQALEVCKTLLRGRNLHLFRASWATIMRGVAAVRSRALEEQIEGELDSLIDSVIQECKHLLSIHTNALHYLRLIRYRRTEARAAFVLQLYRSSHELTVRRACIDCWRHWKDRGRFLELRRSWQTQHAEEQRMTWLAAGDFREEGEHFRKQVGGSLEQIWALGIEGNVSRSFARIYSEWAQDES